MKLHVEKPEFKKRNDRIVALYTQGKSTTQIAPMVSLSPSAVLYVIRNRKVKRKPNGWYPKPTPAYSKMIRAYAESIVHKLGTGPGTSAEALAKAASIKPGTLRMHLRALGVHSPHGMGEGNVRLNVEQVRWIKGALASGRVSQAEIARKFKIGTSTVGAIAVGHTWTRVPWPGGKAYKPNERRRPARRSSRKPRATSGARKSSRAKRSRR